MKEITLNLADGITNLPFPRWIGIKYIKEYKLVRRLSLEQWVLPVGTTIKLWQGQNFGQVYLPEGTKDESGYVMHRRLFRY